MSGAPGGSSGADAPVRTAWRDDLIAVLAGGLLIAGLFLDGWHHLYLANGQDGSFFTPWHIPLYAGFNACAIWTITRNERLRLMLAPRGARAGRRVAAGPPGLGMILVGLAIAAVGVVGDAIARTTGARPAGEALAPPFNLLVVAGAAIVFVVAVRAVVGRAITLRAVTGMVGFDRRIAIAALAAAGAAAIAFVAFGGTSPREPADRVSSAAVAARPKAQSEAPAPARERAAAPAVHARAAAHPSSSASRAAATPRHRAARRVATAAPRARRVTTSHHARVRAERVHARRVAPSPRVVVHRRRPAARPAPTTPVRRHRRRPAWRPAVVPGAPAAAPTVITTTTTTTVANSPSAAPTPATKPADPVNTPTAGPTPVTTPTPAPSPTPPAGPKHGGPGPG